MKTFLVTSTVQFIITCNDNGKLTDSIYDELGYNVETYSKLVLDELQNNFVGHINKSPVIKQIE